MGGKCRERQQNQNYQFLNMKVSNPRFPHTCTIYRMIDETSFDEGEKQILYEGVCRKYSGTSLRTFKTENVIKSDYALSLPGIIEGIMAGDLIDVTDRQGTFIQCVVSDSYAGNLGTTVYFNLAKN